MSNQEKINHDIELIIRLIPDKSKHLYSISANGYAVNNEALKQTKI